MNEEQRSSKIKFYQEGLDHRLSNPKRVTNRFVGFSLQNDESISATPMTAFETHYGGEDEEAQPHLHRGDFTMTLDDQHHLMSSADKYGKRSAFMTANQESVKVLDRKMNHSSASLERSITRLAQAQREGKGPVYSKISSKFANGSRTGEIKRAQTAKRRDPRQQQPMMNTI